MKTQQYTITLHGCDDCTSMVMELTEKEVEFVKALCAKSEEASAYSCMPTMTIEVGDTTE